MLNTSANTAPGAAPSIPLARATAEIIDNVSDDERRLAAELEELLSRRPSVPREPHAEAPRPEASEALADDHYNQGFAWRPSEGQSVHSDDVDEAAADADLRQGVVPPSSLVWLNRAKSHKRWTRARRAGAWVLTLLIGGAIIAGAAFVLTGQMPDLPAFAAWAVGRVL